MATIAFQQRETPEERAARLLRNLLPPIRSRDNALEHLYYITPDATPELRLWSIAAAVFILSESEGE